MVIYLAKFGAIVHGLCKFGKGHLYFSYSNAILGWGWIKNVMRSAQDDTDTSINATTTVGEGEIEMTDMRSN